MEIYGLLLMYKRVFRAAYGHREHSLGQALINVPLTKAKFLRELVKELSAGTTPDGYLEKHGLDEQSVESDEGREAVHYALRAAYHESNAPVEAKDISAIQVLQIIPPGQLPMY